MPSLQVILVLRDKNYNFLEISVEENRGDSLLRQQGKRRLAEEIFSQLLILIKKISSWLQEITSIWRDLHPRVNHFTASKIIGGVERLHGVAYRRQH
jgi:hypothetical protein